MIKIFVTGDNHIGMKYGSHEKSAILCEKRISAFENMVEQANREACDLFVITGDLFENNYGISKKNIETVLGTLSHFNGTVVVLPGNHDFYDKDKMWQTFEDVMKKHDNIWLLKEYKPYEVSCGDEDVILYPALCTSKHSEEGQNNLDKIRNMNFDNDSAYRIGIAHGAVEGETIDNEGKYFLMSRAELESIPVDVWLIGHTHVPFPRNLTENFTACDKILNPGTHVQTDVSCNTEGCCFIVEISDDKTVRAKKYVSGNIRFYRKNIALSASSIKDTLERELADIGDESVVDIILSGAVTSEEYEDRTQIIKSAISRFTEGTYSDEELSKLISKALIDAEFSETSFSAKLLESLLGEPKEAQLAYEMLKSLKEGK